jgi:hypothetical protein
MAFRNWLASCAAKDTVLSLSSSMGISASLIGPPDLVILGPSVGPRPLAA